MKRLSIINAAIILSLVFISSQSVSGQFKDRGNFRGDHREMMIEKLQLTEDQQEAIEELRFEHQNEMIDLKSDVQRKKLQLQELKRSGNYTREEFLASVKSLSEAKQQIALVKANHRMDVYELLTDEQKETFDKIRPRRDEGRQQLKNKRFRRDF